MFKTFHSKIVYERGALVVCKSIEYSHETVKCVKVSVERGEQVDLLRNSQICKLLVKARDNADVD